MLCRIDRGDERASRALMGLLCLIATTGHDGLALAPTPLRKDAYIKITLRNAAPVIQFEEK
jgi:hypothetical protein